MATLADLKTRIADELARADLTSQIALAIRSATDHYARQRFWFNEYTFTFNTVAEQEFYTSSDSADIGQMAMIDEVRITVNNSTYTLIRRDWGYLENIQSNSSYTGDPTDWVWYQEKIRLYPIPFTARAIQVSGVRKETASSLSGSTSGSGSGIWTNEGEALIRTRAKFELYADVIKDPEMAEVQKQRERDELKALTDETVQRVTAGRLRPTGF